jgi:iron(III) transport system substrate-binding protein
LLLAVLTADANEFAFPVSQNQVVAAAKREGTLVVYDTLHARAAINDIHAAFEKLYPFIKIQESDGDSTATYQRLSREAAEGRPSADVVWSSAMDLQEKLINDGYAQPYTSPEMDAIPAWAHWQNLGYDTTLEPIVFVYNSRFIPRQEMANTHAGLRQLLRTHAKEFAGRVATYDPENSLVGMLLLTQDIRSTHDAWQLFDAFGSLDSRGYLISQDIVNHVISGEQWIGYDVIGSYAEDLRKSHPELVVVYPADYALTLSRVAFIAAGAKHPNAAKLFMDFLLSAQGQAIFVKHGIGSVRREPAQAAVQPGIDLARNQIIRIGPGLLSDMDSLVRAEFLRRWNSLRRS